MKFISSSDSILKSDYSCVVVPFFKDTKFNQQHKSLIELDNACKGYISEMVKIGDISGKVGSAHLLYDLDGVNSERVILLGCGSLDKFSLKVIPKVINTLFNKLKEIKLSDMALYILEDDFYKNESISNLKFMLRKTITSLFSSNYTFDDFKSEKSSYSLQEVSINIPSNLDKESLDLEINIATFIGESTDTCKTLANYPPNICHANYLDKYCKSLAKEHTNLQSTSLNFNDMETLGMGAFCAVAQARKDKAKLITISYDGGNKSQQPIVLIGKGITFDTGGNSLKPSMSMIGMKYDMSGAATVIGIMEFAAKAKLPLNIIGILAAAENMPGSDGCRPDDIVTTMSGQTVEILNTDAEGRLVLCDSLTYVKRFNPELIIDCATLTGSASATFGTVFSALFSNDETLAEELLAAGKRSQDEAWQLPLTNEYHEMLNCKAADMANIGTGGAGASVAGCFLEKFVDKDMKWAHLDIAGSVGDMKGKNRGATGRPTSLLAEFLLSKCNY